ncbi:ABC transporter substrate-binding protein [Paenibacillus crassostreae]|nr:ABC transporter substrate-binding protein [Paenibacillus crassostreae]
MSTKWMKLGTQFLAVVMMCSVIVACGEGTKSSNSSTNASVEVTASGGNATPAPAPEVKEPVSVKTTYYPFIGGFNIYALKDKEYDLANGVNLQIDAMGAASPLMGLMTRDTDVAFMTLQSYMVSIGTLIEEGTDINSLPKIVYLHNGSTGGDGIVTDSENETVADLKGKTIGASFGEVTHYMLAKALETEGMTIDDIKMVDMGPSKAGSAFVAGSIDAAVTFEPYLSEGVKSRNGKIIIDTTTLTNTILDVVVVRADTAAEKPEWVTGVLKSIEDATQFISTDLESAAELAADDLQVSKEEVIEMYPTFYLYTHEDNKVGMGENGWIFETMKDVLDFYLEIGTLSTTYDYSLLITDEFLW